MIGSRKEDKLINNQSASHNGSSDSATSPSIESKSSADIPSNLIDLDDEELGPNAVQAAIKRESLVQDWKDRDQFRFEFMGDSDIRISADYNGREDRLDGDKLNMRDEACLAKTPTTDHQVQTSRRPTLNKYDCHYGYHFPSSPTASMISELAKEVQKVSSDRVSAIRKPPGGIKSGKVASAAKEEEEKALEKSERLREMFPTAPGLIVHQMIRIYHGREGLIKAALISLGYKRASEYGSQLTNSQSPIMLMMSKPSSKKLFDKLTGYFPEKDPNLIKNLLYKHKEVEHEVISALVESSDMTADESSGQSSRSRQGMTDWAGARRDKHGVTMKLRYLKSLFPSCEEIEFYHLLHRLDFNAQKVAELMESKGHQKANIDELMEKRQSRNKQMRDQQAVFAARDQTPVIDPLEAHRKRTKPVPDQRALSAAKTQLKQEFPQLNEAMLSMALDAADNSVSLASKFLKEVEPAEEVLNQRQLYRFKRETGPDVVLFPCKAVQKGGSSFMSILANESVSIERQVLECKTALALLKVDASTFTGDDFPKVRQSKARGPCLELASGAKPGRCYGPSIWRRLGPFEGLRLGSKYEQCCADPSRLEPNAIAQGRNKDLALGQRADLRSGRNPSLLQRIHPFMMEQ